MNPESAPFWRRLQQRSGLLLSLFLTMHLLNQAAAAAGPEVYVPLQRALRLVYQQPVVELVAVLLALVVHVAAGVVLMAGRRFAIATPSPLLRLHRVAGRFLAVVILGHIVATRGPSLVWGLPLEWNGVALSMLALPAVYVPYYLLLGVSGVVHGVTGVAISISALGLRPGLVRHRALLPVVAVASAAVILGVLGLAGVVVDVDADAVWRSDIARRLIDEGLVSPP